MTAVVLLNLSLSLILTKMELKKELFKVLQTSDFLQDISRSNATTKVDNSNDFLSLLVSVQQVSWPGDNARLLLAKEV